MSQDYVLIAEPDARVARTFEQFAREAALEHVTTRDGAEARGVIHGRGVPALVVTNLVLPRLDGFGLIEVLRRLEARVPVVVVSSSMQLRTTASNLRSALGITEILATGMSATSLRAGFVRALAATKHAPPKPPEPRPSDTAPFSRAALELARREHEVACARPTKPPPSRDPARLARIAALGLVDEDRPPDAALQALVEETARTMNVPVALVSLVLEQRQWFKAHVGLSGELLSARGTPLDQAFCRHVIDADVPTPLIVPDAVHHPFFSSNEHVKSGAVGSYAGAPLLTSDGTALGTLCIIDSKPLTIGQAQVDQLVALSRRVAGELELRNSSHRPSAQPPQAELGHDALHAVLAHLECGVLLTDMDRKIKYANRALSDLLGLAEGELRGWTRPSFVHRLAALSDDGDGILRRLSVLPEGPIVAREELVLSQPKRRVLRWTETPIRLANGLMQLGCFNDVTAEEELRTAYDVPVMFVDDEN